MDNFPLERREGRRGTNNRSKGRNQASWKSPEYCTGCVPFETQGFASALVLAHLVRPTAEGRCDSTNVEKSHEDGSQPVQMSFAFRASHGPTALRPCSRSMSPIRLTPSMRRPIPVKSFLS